jgi:hypothetical protein
LVARVTHAAEFNLRFGDPARKFPDCGIRVWPSNFARERFYFFA